MGCTASIASKVNVSVLVLGRIANRGAKRVARVGRSGIDFMKDTGLHQGTKVAVQGDPVGVFPHSLAYLGLGEGHGGLAQN